MKKLILSVVFFTTVLSTQGAFAQMCFTASLYPVPDSLVRSFNFLAFSDTANSIERFNNKQQQILFIEKAEKGLWVITYSYDSLETRNQDDMVFFYNTPQSSLTGWSVNEEYRDSEYIPILIRKVLKILL